MLAIAAAQTMAGSRSDRVGIKPFGHAAVEGTDLGLRTRYPFNKLEDASALVEKRPPVLREPAVLRRP